MVDKDPRLTQHQQSIIDFIAEFESKYKHPPSIRDVQGNVGIDLPSVVNYHLQHLEKRGFIKISKNVVSLSHLPGDTTTDAPPPATHPKPTDTNSQ